MTNQVAPFNYLSGRDTFQRIREHTWNLFLSQSHGVPPMAWQGRETKPEFATYELMNYTFTHRLNECEDLEVYREDVKPNLPWADDHFEERVCGKPINPGVEWANWPWGNNAANFLDQRGMFNHNYMERYWPKYAGCAQRSTQDGSDWDVAFKEYNESRGSGFVEAHTGIRNSYGDLNDLVRSIAINPLSRQEWFPIFHPEDVGNVQGGRKPCSLGYQFWVRNNQLHCYYPLRSCDFMHHMQDDIYLTIRLMLWVLNECRRLFNETECRMVSSNPIYPWEDVKPGTLTMHCTSLHVFANDMIIIRKEGPK